MKKCRFFYTFSTRFALFLHVFYTFLGKKDEKTANMSGLFYRNWQPFFYKKCHPIRNLICLTIQAGPSKKTDKRAPYPQV